MITRDRGSDDLIDLKICQLVSGLVFNVPKLCVLSDIPVVIERGAPGTTPEKEGLGFKV